MPILECEHGSIGQSGAINFYVASECGLMGSSLFEAAQILSFVEHLAELKAAYVKLVPWGSKPSAEAEAAFFDLDEAKDFTGPADASKRPSRLLNWYLGRLEGLVGSNGFAVGGQLSLADVLIFNALAETLQPSEAAADFPSYRREPFGNAAKTAAALDTHPKIKAIVDNIAANQNMKKWLATRGKQGF